MFSPFKSARKCPKSFKIFIARLENYSKYLLLDSARLEKYKGHNFLIWLGSNFNFPA